MRAVLDTNVIVSGLLSPAGNARLILAMAFARKFDLIVSAELFAEYEGVIRRPKFRFRSEKIDEASRVWSGLDLPVTDSVRGS